MLEDFNKKRVLIRQVDRESTPKLKAAGYSKLMSRLLAARGINDPSMMDHDIDNLIPVDELKNARAMAKQIADAIIAGQRILIVSDYDCDGATACCVLYKTFESFGANFDYLVPDRMVHGYGLTPSIVQDAASLEKKPDYLITVDNGVSSLAGVEEALRLGMKVWVTDHHLPGDKLPAAEVIVNPNLADCSFPSKALAGCGVAYYVAWALFDEMESRGFESTIDLYDLLPYVALGTIADVVQLDKNNRILVAEGMKRIRHGMSSEGIKAIAEVASRDISLLSCSDIGFNLGPRINAAGRLEHMSTGIECLLCDDRERSVELAKELDSINRERRRQQETMLDDGVKQLSEKIADDIRKTGALPYSLIAYDPSWHEGIVGVVAGRVKDTFNRPTLVMTDAQDGSIKASGRSIPGLHLKHVLDEIYAKYPGLILKFGGHAMAAGLTIQKGALDQFKGIFEEVCKEHMKELDLRPVVYVDHIEKISDLDINTINEIRFAVWGQGFPEPVFMTEGSVLSVKRMGQDANHTKVSLEVNGASFEAVKFFDGEWTPEGVQPFVFKASINEFRGKKSVQLLIEDTNFEVEDLTVKRKKVPS